MMHVETMYEHLQQEPDRRWIPSRPLPGDTVDRLRDAWDVLRGRAEAVVWPSPEAREPYCPVCSVRGSHVESCPRADCYGKRGQSEGENDGE